MKCANCGTKVAKRDWANQAELCAGCYHEAGLENEHQDGYHEEQSEADCPMCREERQEGETVKAIEDMNRDELRKVAKQRGLKVAGTKQELIDRINEDIAKEQPELTKTNKPQATRHGGRTLIPGYTMNEAREVVASTLAECIAKAAPQEEAPETLAMVESLLMDAADAEPTPGASVTADMGRVLNEYLRQDRPDRYNYILVKLFQATGRKLERNGYNRRTGLKAKGKGGR